MNEVDFAGQLCYIDPGSVLVETTWWEVRSSNNTLFGCSYAVALWADWQDRPACTKWGTTVFLGGFRRLRPALPSPKTGNTEMATVVHFVVNNIGRNKTLRWHRFFSVGLMKQDTSQFWLTSSWKPRTRIKKCGRNEVMWTEGTPNPWPFYPHCGT